MYYRTYMSNDMSTIGKLLPIIFNYRQNTQLIADYLKISAKHSLYHPCVKKLLIP